MPLNNTFTGTNAFDANVAINAEVSVRDLISLVAYTGATAPTPFNITDTPMNIANHIAYTNSGINHPVKGTLNNENVFNQMQIGLRPLVIAQGANDQHNNYIGQVGNNNADTPLQFDIYYLPGTGLQIAPSISTAPAFTAALSVIGNIACTGTTTSQSFTTTSDYRLKMNVQQIALSQHNIDKLNPVHYNWTSDPTAASFGLIAHEVEPIFPFLVKGSKDASTHQSIEYTGLIGLLVKEVQSLKERVLALENSGKK